MKWEVSTMVSGTSYFNSTLYRKTITRFWPLWALWGVMWLFLMPFNLLSRYFDEMRWGDSVANARETIINASKSLPELMMFGVMMAMAVGVLVAMASFGYLYNNRSACMMHALPMRRETIFTTQYLAGLSMLLVPLAGAGVLMVIVQMSLVPDPSLWPTMMKPLLILELAMAGVCLFFYSFATFCAMFTGNILALPIFYGILNCLVMVLSSLVVQMMRSFYYGYSASSFVLSDYLTPFIRLQRACMWWPEKVMQDGDIYTRVYHLQSPTDIAIYTGVGLLLTVVSLYIYRHRHIESAGDVVTVPVVKPIFKYGVALCSGLCLGTLVSEFFGWYYNSSIPMVSSMLVCTAIGYFVAEMLLKQTFRVQKSWKGCVAAVAAMLAIALVCMFDVFGVEKRVPTVDQVERVELSSGGSFGYPHSYRGLSLFGSDKELIEYAVGLHQGAVDAKDRGNGDDYISFQLIYKLKNGTTLERSYYGVPVYREELEQEGTLTWYAQQILQDEDMVRIRYDMDFYDRGVLLEAYVDNVRRENGEMTTLYLKDQTEDLKGLWNAVCQDMQEKNLGIHTLFAPDGETSDYATPYAEFIWIIGDDQSSEDMRGYSYVGGDTSYQRQYRIGVTLQPQARHTLDWLKENGIIQDDGELFRPAAAEIG